jgi:hypothetical protein
MCFIMANRIARIFPKFNSDHYKVQNPLNTFEFRYLVYFKVNFLFEMKINKYMFILNQFKEFDIVVCRAYVLTPTSSGYLSKTNEKNLPGIVSSVIFYLDLAKLDRLILKVKMINVCLFFTFTTTTITFQKFLLTLVSKWGLYVVNDSYMAWALPLSICWRIWSLFEFEKFFFILVW